MNSIAAILFITGDSVTGKKIYEREECRAVTCSFRMITKPCRNALTIRQRVYLVDR